MHLRVRNILKKHISPPILNQTVLSIQITPYIGTVYYTLQFIPNSSSSLRPIKIEKKNCVINLSSSDRRFYESMTVWSVKSTMLPKRVRFHYVCLSAKEKTFSLFIQLLQFWKCSFFLLNRMNSKTEMFWEIRECIILTALRPIDETHLRQYKTNKASNINRLTDASRQQYSWR